MQFIEDAHVSGTRKTADGYMVADVRCARTGIQTYLGSELGKPNLSTVKVYRPETAVFAKDSLKTFAGKPVTDDHPTEMVDANNWSELAKGQIGNEIARDGEYVRVPVMVMDADTIAKIEAGKRQWSMGYSMDLRFEDGETPDGEKYDAVMDNIKINHLALVDIGRAGHECRVGDGASRWGVAPFNATDKETKSMATRTVMLDGLPVETTDAGAIALDKVTKERNTFEQSLLDAEAKHTEALAGKDKELAAKDAEIKALKDAAMDAAAVDKMVADRSTLLDGARKIAADVDFAGMSAADVRKAAVIAAQGEDAIAQKSEAYIEAAFDIAVKAAADNADKPASVDPVRAALAAKDGKKDPKDNGQTAYEKRISDAWKGE